MQKSCLRNLRLRRAAARLFCFALAALLLSPHAAAYADAAPKTVRMGYFYNGDFMYREEDGTYAGYDIEYVETLAGYAGWQIEFVPFDGLAPALAALSAGDIDLMSGLSKTPERESRYLIAAQKMCTAHIAVQTRAEDDRFAPGDTDTMRDMTCGILKGSNVVALYANWCAENGLTPHIAEYDSLEARNAALSAGEVDAIAGGSTIAGAQKIAEFPSLDLFFMFSAGSTALKAGLDRAMNILSLQEPNYAENLFLKYFPASRNTTPSFSAAEKRFIAAHAALRVAVLADDAPFSKAQADGTAAGILPDYYAHLSAVTGMQFVCVPYGSREETCAAVRAGEADLVGKFENDVFDATRQGFLLSTPYLSMSMEQVTRAGTTSISALAVPVCNEKTVRAGLKDESGMSLTLCPNGEESFAALKNGSADAVVCTQPAVAWLLSRNRASDYVVTAFPGADYAVSCALPGGADGNTLRSILNKTIAVDDGYITQLITTETLADSADLTNLLDRMPVAVITGFGAAAAVLLLIACAALAVIVRRRGVEKRLAAQTAALAAAEEANRARHAFFGTVSHDMRTPLNGIMGFADLALASGDPDTVRGYLQKIRASGAMLTNLVNDTLILSRMENDKYTLKPARCSTREIFEGVLEPIRVQAAQKDVAFTDNVQEVPARWVMADRLSVQKILLNLLTNAVKFTPAGGTVTLRCSLVPREGGSPDTVFTVSDTGVGISPEFLPHVFEPFAQENAAAASTGGSGMGLAIVKSIVDAMHGTITAESEKNRGTRFTVRLHLPETDAPDAARAGAPDAARLRGRRALVCEDNALNREILCRLLTRLGIETEAVENGRQGAERFAASEQGHFDFVLLDLRMPVMGGVEAARTIRALPRPDAGSVPILAISADAYPENSAECLAAGMNAHLAKPIDADALTRALLAFLH